MQIEILEDLRAKEKSGTRFVYPVFVKKIGHADYTLDVSLSGKATDYRAMSEAKFKEFIRDNENTNNYPSATVRAAVKSEQLNIHEEAQRNGYLHTSNANKVRNFNH